MQTDLQVWLAHFEYHAGHRCALPQYRHDDLTPFERGLIARSIATFQLGEQSDGKHLLRAAQAYACRHDAPALAQVTELLIAEERHHAHLLGEFMRQHGLPRRKSDWTDFVFRRVRRLAGFRLQMHVLVTAELIGKVYYRALEAATGCRQLRTLCRLLVADELAHIGFETDLLRGMHARYGRFAGAALRLLHRAFFSGAAVTVWLSHRKVLRAAGYGPATFLRACLAQYTFYLSPPERAAPGHSGDQGNELEFQTSVR